MRICLNEVYDPAVQQALSDASVEYGSPVTLQPLGTHDPAWVDAPWANYDEYNITVPYSLHEDMGITEQGFLSTWASNMNDVIPPLTPWKSHP